METRDLEALERVQDLLDERGQNELFVGTVVYAITDDSDMTRPELVVKTGELHLAEINKMIEEGYQVVDQIRTITFDGDEAQFTRLTVLVRNADIIRIPEGLTDD
jgi:acetolactate synthase small subunit